MSLDSTTAAVSLIIPGAACAPVHWNGSSATVYRVTTTRRCRAMWRRAGARQPL